jgi:thioredoxin 1
LVRPEVLERVGAEAFDGQRLRRPGLAVVVFLADWCPFCQVFRPLIERATEKEGWTTLDADLTEDDAPLWDRFSVEVVPSVIIFRDGTPVLRVDGVRGVGLGPAALEAVRRAVHDARAG